MLTKLLLQIHMFNQPLHHSITSHLVSKSILNAFVIWQWSIPVLFTSFLCWNDAHANSQEPALEQCPLYPIQSETHGGIFHYNISTNPGKPSLHWVYHLVGHVWVPNHLALILPPTVSLFWGLYRWLQTLVMNSKGTTKISSQILENFSFRKFLEHFLCNLSDPVQTLEVYFAKAWIRILVGLLFDSMLGSWGFAFGW